MRAVLPASWVAAGYGVPQVCSRHGELAVEGAKTRIHSKPPGWAYILLALGALAFLIAVYSTRKTVVSPSWPFCDRCKVLRTRLLVAGVLGIAAGVILFCGGISFAMAVGEGAVGEEIQEADWLGTVLGVSVLVGICVLIAGAIVASRSTRAAVADARVSEDGVWVEVWKAHRGFCEQVAAVARQANAQPAYAPQQAYSPQPYGQYPLGPAQPPGGYGPYAPPR